MQVRFSSSKLTAKHMRGVELRAALSDRCRYHLEIAGLQMLPSSYREHVLISAGLPEASKMLDDVLMT